MTWFTTAYIGLALIVVGAFLAAKEHLWISSAQVVEGTVIKLASSRSGTSTRRKTSFAPVVQFRSNDGREHEFQRGYNSNPPGYVRGEKVAVAYDPRTGEGRILSFGERFGFAAAIAVVGFAIVCMAAAFIVGRKFVPRVYQERMTAPLVEAR